MGKGIRYRASPLDLAIRAKNLSRREFASRIGVISQTIHHYSRGAYTPRLSVGVLMANLLFEGDMNKLLDCLIACGHDLPERTPTP